MNTNDHPLAGVLKERTLGVRVSRLIVVEWLFPEDEKTGSLLASRVRALGIPVEHIVCAAKEDVVRAFRKVALESFETSVPIVHIEAHGDDGSGNGMPRGFVGPDASGDALLSWAELGDELRPINLATRFNLIVVGAACYGEGLLLALEPGKSVPFVLALGYRGKVSPASLRDALIQFYRLLLDQQWPFAEAVEAANREHRENDSELRVTSAAQLVLEGFCGAKPRSPQFEALPRRVRKALEREAVREGWRLHFAFDRIPENAKRFEIDLEELIRVMHLNPVFPE